LLWGAAAVRNACLAAADSWPAAATPPEPLKVREVPVLDELRFTGLRRIAPAAVAAQLKSREGAPFDAANIGKDLRALATLGWFEFIQVEEGSPTVPPPQALETSNT